MPLFSWAFLFKERNENKGEEHMKISKSVAAILVLATILAVAASCGGDKQEQPTTSTVADTSAQSTVSAQNTQPSSPEQSSAAQNEPSAANQTETAPNASTSADAKANDPVIDMDRDGNPITLPATMERIISMGPSNTEVLVALGFADRIIATDTYSENVPGINAGISLFSMMSPDGEQIISLAPDVIFVTGMSRAGGEDPFKIIADAGICLVYMPSSTSIEAIKEDIRFMAAVMGVVDKGEEIVVGMEKEIDDIVAVTKTLDAGRKVYFEIGAAPYMYSFGHDTFLNEMIGMLGGVNIFADQNSWISVADEAVLAADPDIILTSVNYIDDPIGEIKSRDGWDVITAIKNDAVYYISTDASNRPSHNIVIALRQMAEAIYPGAF